MARKKTITDRRGEVLRSADRLFTHYGYEKTTMEDISREAGIPRATIYLEFPGGKEDILTAHIAEYLERILSEMQKITKSAKTGRLEALKQALLHCILSAYDKATHQFDPNNIEKCSTRIRTEMNEYYERRHTFYAEVLQQAALAGEIQSGQDYLLLAELISHGCRSWMPSFTIRLPRETLERNVNSYLSILLTGLAHQKAKKLPYESF